MFIGFFDFCQELMSGYKIWLIFTVILCMILLKFGYAFMLEIHNEDYPDEFDDEDDLEEEKAEEVVCKQSPYVCDAWGNADSQHDALYDVLVVEVRSTHGR